MSSRKNIAHLLSQIKKSDRFERREDPSQVDEQQRPTSFGAPLMRSGEGRYRVDMSEVLVLSGVSDLASALAGQFQEQYRANDADQLVAHAVNSAATPELAALGIRQIALHIRRKLAALLARHPDFLNRHLRRVIGSLQNHAVRSDLFPQEPGNTPPPGRLFPFDTQPPDFPEGYILMEYEPEAAFLRLTLETADDQRLHLKRIAHRVCTARELSLFDQDAATIAAAIALGLNQAGRYQREFHAETPDRQPAIFHALRQTDLRDLSLLRFTWRSRDTLALLENRDSELLRLLARALILLQEESATRLLADGCEIELLSGKHLLYLDLSRRGACLNASLLQRRRQADLPAYLRRLPLVARLAGESRNVLAGVRVVFIHHFTAETLAVIEALRVMGCAHLHGLFIRYKGLLPDAYLEALLALPEQQFVFHSLNQTENDSHLMGRYLLAREFSPVQALAPLDEELRRNPLDYFKAMRAAACHILMRELLEARRTGQKVLLIEDGGYAAPVFNQWTAEQISLDDSLRRCLLPTPDGETSPLPPVTLAEWLPGYLLATIEHTRNGYDQLMDVRRRFGPPVVPAYTIALSKYKNTAEARGAAMAILMAAEYIMAGQGDSLHTRQSLVIGSRGFIGRHLLTQLAARGGPDRAAGVDIVASANPSDLPTEYPSLADLPPEVLARTDLIIGITGHPILTPEAVAHILVNGRSRRLYLVSGSTKNVEFARITDWLQDLRHREDARIGPYPVRLETLILRDPLTEIAQGSSARIHFDLDNLPPGITPEEPWKDILMPADGMPLNFNFFGVPGEIMDRVMEQLLFLCRLAVQRQASPPPPDIYALDHNLDIPFSSSPEASSTPPGHPPS